MDHTLRRELLEWVMAAWGGQALLSQQHRSVAFFDAMGGQLRSTQRRCSLMEERAIRWEPLRNAMSAWRGATRSEQQRRFRAKHLGLVFERLSSELAAVSARRCFGAWKAGVVAKQVLRA